MCFQKRIQFKFRDKCLSLCHHKYQKVISEKSSGYIATVIRCLCLLENLMNNSTTITEFISWFLKFLFHRYLMTFLFLQNDDSKILKQAITEQMNEVAVILLVLTFVFLRVFPVSKAHFCNDILPRLTTVSGCFAISHKKIQLRTAKSCCIKKKHERVSVTCACARACMCKRDDYLQATCWKVKILRIHANKWQTENNISKV